MIVASGDMMNKDIHVQRIKKDYKYLITLMKQDTFKILLQIIF